MSSSLKQQRQQQHPAPEPDDVPASKRTRPDTSVDPPIPGGPLRVVLNPADCDLDFDIVGSGLQGHGLHEQGFAYCWSGGRANVGIKGGKYCFGCKIVSEQVVDLAETPSDQQHVCRVGISRGDDPVGNLGETSNSFGFGGTGKFSNSRKFLDYGEKFGLGDTILCCVDLEKKPLATIGFSKNGKWLGVALQFDASSWGLGVVDFSLKIVPWESALFPHVLLKNVEVQLQFSIEDGLVPEEGYKPWNCAIEDGNVILGPSFLSSNECEVMMMVGLPASGKTTWAEKWVKEHLEKRYVILGTNLALDQMKVPGLLRKQNYGERFERLMDRATGIFNTLLARAAKTPRNYILDQTNVYKSARIRKLKPFVNYRKIAVVVFPKPEDWKLRADKRFKEMGKDVPQEAVNEMLANYVLPTSKDVRGSSEVFDEVIFTELGRSEAQRQLDEMKRELKIPNLSAQTFSPYSHDSSIQSFSSIEDVNRETTSAVGGHQPCPQPMGAFPHRDNWNPHQVNQAYASPGSFVGHGARLGAPNISHSNISPHGRYSNVNPTAFQRDGFGPYQNSREFSPYIRDASARSFTSVADASTYQSYRTAENSSRLSSASPVSMGGGTGYEYESGPQSYSSPGSHLHDPRAFQVSRDGLGRTNVQGPSSIGEHGHSFPSEPSSYSSPGAYMRIPGSSQLESNASRMPSYEWHGPHQTPYGAPYASSALRPPPPTPPPVNHPRRSWYH